MLHRFAPLPLRQSLAALAGLACAAVAAVCQAQDIVRAVIPSPAGVMNHAAAIAELKSGALLVCWYSGRTERGVDVRILCARGSADGARWSQPWTAVAPGERAMGAAGPNKSLGNVTLTVTPKGRVWMIYGVVQSRRWPLVGETCTNWACGRIDGRASDDEGRTWAPARRLLDIEGALPRAELKAAAGGYLAPFYEESRQRSVIVLVRLDDAGPSVRQLWPLKPWKLIQPALAPASDGRFRVYFRDQLRRAVFTASFDPRTGAFAGVRRTNLPNPGAAIDVFADDFGRYVLIYNPSSRSRDRLALARASDGAHFARGCDLSLPASQDGAAYPSVIRGADGDWRVVYSSGPKLRINFVRFSSRWLEKCFASKG